jgi:DNA-binding response OmpR family regulator
MTCSGALHAGNGLKRRGLAVKIRLIHETKSVANPGISSLLRFGLFELDLRTGELRKRGVKIKLQDQPFQILVMLLELPCKRTGCGRY